MVSFSQPNRSSHGKDETSPLQKAADMESGEDEKRNSFTSSIRKSLNDHGCIGLYFLWVIRLNNTKLYSGIIVLVTYSTFFAAALTFLLSFKDAWLTVRRKPRNPLPWPLRHFKAHPGAGA